MFCRTTENSNQRHIFKSDILYYIKQTSKALVAGIVGCPNNNINK